MLSENIKKLRQVKGLSQEELALSLNVVRQTISKWEKGLSVPDSEMLIKLANELDTTVNVLLGETISESEATEIQILSKKLELLNKELAKRNEAKRKVLRYIFVIIGTIATLSIVGYIFNEIYPLIYMNKINASASVIGGADGPTAIFVASSSFKKILSICISAIIAIVSWIGVFKTKKK